MRTGVNGSSQLGNAGCSEWGSVPWVNGPKLSHAVEFLGLDEPQFPCLYQRPTGGRQTTQASLCLPYGTGDYRLERLREQPSVTQQNAGISRCLSQADCT